MPRQPFGQQEPLTTRLRGLIRDYPRGIGIVKEFLQNADDAKASRMEVVMDWRTHSAEGVPEKMRPLLGPALLFSNNETFSDDDLTSIQNIGESVKRLEGSKTGRFGLGFNASYNVTDCPCFVTRGSVYFFDPTCSFVPGSSVAEPGGSWTLAEAWAEHPGLLEPFRAVGLERGATYFEGTAFRLPLRTPEQAGVSPISDRAFGKDSFQHVFELVREAAPLVLLFLKHLLEVRITEVPVGDGESQQLLRVTTLNADEVRGARQLVNDVMAQPFEHVVKRLADAEDDLPEVSYRHDVAVEDGGQSREHEWRVVSGIYRGYEGSLAEAAATMFGHGEKAVPWAGVAAPHPRGGTVSRVEGRIFCSLPLPDPTGLPVHVNGFFDLDSSRQNVFSDGGVIEVDADRVKWNLLLVEDAVAPAYARLLTDLSEDVEEGSYQDYYDLWPTPESASGALAGLPTDLYYWLRDRPVVQCLGVEGSRLLPYGDVLHVPVDRGDVREPLVADGVALPSPPVPEHVHSGFEGAGVGRRDLTPKYVRDRLRASIEDAMPLGEVERECLQREDWVAALLGFCLSDGSGGDMDGTPFGLRVDGDVEPLGSLLFYGDEPEVELFSHRPEYLLDLQLAKQVGFGTTVRPSVHELFKVFDLSHIPPESFVAHLKNLCLSDLEIREWQAGREQVPNESWVGQLIDRLANYWGGRGLEARHLSKLPCIPVSSGRLVSPGGPHAPLLPRQNTPNALVAALESIGAPIVAGGPLLMERARHLATTLPGSLRDVEPLAVVDELVRTRASWEGKLVRTAADSILDFLSGLTTFPTIRADKDRMAALAGLRLFPSTDGTLISANCDDAFVPDAEDLPAVAGNVRLFETGLNQRWRLLLEGLGAQPLDLARVITKVLLPSYGRLTEHEQFETLRWIRDNLARAVSELADRGDEGQWLDEAVAGTPVVRTVTGGLAAPEDLYDPSAERIVVEVLGERAAFPDMTWYSHDGRTWRLFFERLGMSASPRPDDILGYVDDLVAEAKEAGASAVADRALGVLDHLDSYWFDVADMEVQAGGTLAHALRGRAWLPARRSKQGANFPMFAEPEDRLYRPSELYPPSLAPLVASQHPILPKRDTRSEVARGLNSPTQPPFDSVIAHLDVLLEAWGSGAPPFTEGQLVKSLNGIYQFLGRSFQDEPACARLKAHYDGRPCLWHPGKKRFYRADHTFSSKQARIMEPLRAAVRVDDAQDRGYVALGRRSALAASDVADYLRDLATRQGEGQLDDPGVERVLSALRLLRSLLDQHDTPLEGLPVLTAGRQLMPPARVFLPDAPDVLGRLALDGVGLLHGEVPNTIALKAGVRSLNRSLQRIHVGEKTASLDGPFRDEVERLQRLVRSDEFGAGLARLVQHDGRHFREASVRWIDRLSLVAVEALQTELWVDIEGERLKLGEGTDSAFFGENDVLYLAEGPVGLLPVWLAATLNQELDEDQRLADTSALVEVLRVDPEEVSVVLNHLRVRLPREDSWTEQEGQEDVEGEIEVMPMGVAETDEDGSPHLGALAGDGTSGPVLVVTPTDDSDDTDVVDQPAPDGLPATESADGLGEVQPDTSDEGGGSGQVGADKPEGSRPGGVTRGRVPTSPAPGAVRPPGVTLGREWTGGSGGSPAGGSQPAPNGHGGARRHAGTPGTGRGRGGRRVVSMVSYPYEDGARLDCQDFDGDGNERNLTIGLAAVARVLTHEGERGRQTEEMPHYNPGYDVESTDPETGEIRHIEVKGMAGPWGERGAPLSRRQFRFGLDNPGTFWLYVVEYAEDPENARVWPIKDPIAAVAQFRFDSRWRAVAEAGESPPPKLYPQAGLRLVHAGSMSEITGVKGNGKLTRVQIRPAGGEEHWVLFQPNRMEVLPAAADEGTVHADGGESEE